MDLTTEEGVKQYLQTNGYETCHKVERLPEGVCGFVYRAHQNIHPHTIVVKHVAKYAARAPQYELDQNRLMYEYKALKAFASIKAPAIRVPHVYHFDDKNFILIMKDAGNDVRSLKSWVKTHPISVTMSSPGGSKASQIQQCKKIGSELGHFLAQIHNSSDDIKAQFEGNTSARRLSSRVYFSRLCEEAQKQGFEGEHFRIAAQKGEKDVLESNDVLTAGDFWTGNVLMRESQEGDIDVYVVDFELAKPGTVAFDIGQMAAEMYCLAVFRDRELGFTLLESFFSGYRCHREVSTADLSDIAIRMGAHLFTIAPSAWGTEASESELHRQLEIASDWVHAGVNQTIASIEILRPLLR